MAAHISFVMQSAAGVPVIRQNKSPAASVPAVQQIMLIVRNAAAADSLSKCLFTISHNVLIHFPSLKSYRFLIFVPEIIMP